ncbi:MAG: RNA polymerase-binding protein RbpA [Leucobacter sp.]|nr:RNA polymerase-binding protein RbpA [Leucobacter sp.]
MAERTLRGARIGSTSLQSEEGIEFAPRRRVEYLTEKGMRFAVMFDADAEAPPEWVDQRSGEVGFLDDEAGRVARAEFTEKEGQQRTHWDMLMERRTREELEELLEERLRLLRERRGGAGEE